MENHLRILGAVVNLLTGSGILIYLFFLKQKYRDSNLNLLIAYSSGFNLFLLTYLILKYLDVNMAEIISFSDSGFDIKSLFMRTGGVWIAGMSWAVFRIWKNLAGRGSSKIIDIWFIVLGVLILVSNISYLGGYSELDELVLFLFALMVAATVITGLLLLLWLFISSIKCEASVERVMKKDFCILFSFPYLLMGLMITYILVAGSGNRIYYAVMSFAFLYSLNTAPFIWFKKSYRKYMDLNYSSDETTDYSAVMKEFDLSPRECEVCGLILNGKDNREIEAVLFISYNTVKNHVSNIYKKTGASSRIQLQSLFKSMTVKG